MFQNVEYSSGARVGLYLKPYLIGMCVFVRVCVYVCP